MSRHSPAQMRVLVVMNPLPLHSGVGEVQLRKMLDLVAGSCPNPVVVTANMKAEDFPGITALSYQHDARGAGMLGKIWRQVKSQIKMMLHCQRALKQHGPFDSVIFWVGAEQFLAHMYLRMRRQRTLVYFYGTPKDIPGGGLLARFLSGVRSSIRSMNARLAWQVAVEAPGVPLPKNAVGKAVALPLGIPMAGDESGGAAHLGIPMAKDSDGGTAHLNSTSAATSKRESIALYAGRLADCKGLRELIDASQNPAWPADLRLVIAGDGPWRESLEKEVAGFSNVKMVGWVNGEQLKGWMQRSRFVVLPSETEGLPNALMEGMANGAIPVATAVGGIPHLTDDFRCGQLIEETSAAAVLKAILEISQRKDLEELSTACRQNIVDRFSLAASQEKMRQHLSANRHGRTLILSNLLPGMSEGQSNVAKHLEKKLRRHGVRVTHRNLKSALFNPLFWLGLRRQRRIHVVFRYNKRLSGFLKWLDFWVPGRVSLWALQPPMVKVARHASIDSLFCLSSKTAKMFDETGMVPQLTRLGIDLDRFLPTASCGADGSSRCDESEGLGVNAKPGAAASISPIPGSEVKSATRTDFDVEADQRWVIHVGPVKENRGVRHLAEIAALPNVRVTVISRPGSEADPELREFLQNAGIQIFDQFLESIESLYRSADLMVFPTTDPSGCIELPLSVLEAMACGLPVISLPFGGLVDHFPNGAAGLQLVDTADALADAVERQLDAAARSMQSTQVEQPAQKTQTDLTPFDWNVGLSEILAKVPSRTRRQRRLIMVTGLDGAGKSTLLASLADDLRRDGHRVVVPWCGYEMQLMRPFITLAKRMAGASPKRMESDYHGYRKAMVGASNRPLIGTAYRIMVRCEYTWQNFWKVRLPLWRGQVVLADRYIHDICVAMAANSDEDDATLDHRVRRWTRFVPRPQLKLFVDVPPEVSMQRKDDIPDLEYLTSRRDRYLAMTKTAKFTRLDGTMPPGEVLNHALKATAKQFGPTVK